MGDEDFWRRKGVGVWGWKTLEDVRVVSVSQLSVNTLYH